MSRPVLPQPEQLSTLQVRIPLQSVYDEVDMRTYYQGEMLKRKDADIAGMQTSCDDRTALRPMVETALFNVASHLVKRARDVQWGIFQPETEETEETGEETEETGEGTEKEAEPEIICIDIEPHLRVPTKDMPHVNRLMQKYVLDYIANYVVYEWLLTVAPQLAAVPESRNEPLLAKVLTQISRISGMVHRRATDLGGI